MRRALLLALALLAAAPAGAHAGTFRNPVVPVTASGDDTPDPWIFRHGGRYWLTYTSGDHVEVRAARELGGLADATPRRLWPRAGAAAEPADRCCALWAPEIHRLKRPDGQTRWYVYYSANGTSGDTHRIYVLESAGDDPGGRYHFKARLKLPQPFAIDGTVVTVRGRSYLVYSGGPAFTPTALSIVALRDPWTVRGTPLAISQPTLAWEQGVFAVNEGPEALVHGDTLNIIYSASWCGTKAYTLGRLTVGKDDNLLSLATWRDAKRPSPVFSTDAARGVYGPGHGSFFTSPDGRESWMAYHATDEDKGCFTGGLRTTRVQRFAWHADGTPRFGTPVALSADRAAPGGDPGSAVQAEDAPGHAADAVVTDRRLVGYRGLRLAAGERIVLRLRASRAGNYALRLRVLGGDGAGTVGVRATERTLRRGVNRFAFTAGAAVVLDQVSFRAR
ncbi:MAG TPA: family 43 glycosylhydrolase [Baekduia sp.]|nr:family 43 glycosylhydrolase [Baekduia sp.]